MVNMAIATSTAMEKRKEAEEHKFGHVWHFNEIRLYFLFFTEADNHPIRLTRSYGYETVEMLFRCK